MLSAVLYTAIFLAGVVIVYEVANPKIEDMMFKAKFSDSFDQFVRLDNQIFSVAKQAQGAMVTVPFNLKLGMLVFNTSQNQILWRIRSKKELISLSGSAPSNMYIRYGDGAKVIEKKGYYLLENDKLIVNITDNGGTPDSPKPINTSRILHSIYNKLENSTINIPMRLLVNNDPSLETGDGYLEVNERDLRRGVATVVAHINNTIGNYSISFSLSGGADFIRISLLNQ